MSANQKRDGSQGGCSPTATVGTTDVQTSTTPNVSREPKLEDLIPIAVVIAAGCEPCAQRLVAKALRQGSSKRHLHKVLGILEHMQGLDCLTQAVGPSVIARMERPLAAAQRVLAETPAR